MWHELSFTFVCIPPSIFFILFLIWVTRRWRHKVVCPMPDVGAEDMSVLRTMDYGIWTTEYGLWDRESGLWSRDCWVGLGDGEGSTYCKWNPTEGNVSGSMGCWVVGLLGCWVVRLPGRCFSFWPALWFPVLAVHLADRHGHKDIRPSGQ